MKSKGEEKRGGKEERGKKKEEKKLHKPCNSRRVEEAVGERIRRKGRKGEKK